MTEITDGGTINTENATPETPEVTEAPKTQEERKAEFDSKFRALKTPEVEIQKEVVEEVTEEVTEADKDDEQTRIFAPKWKALSKKEKSLFERENAVKLAEEKNKEITELSNMLSEDPIKFMKNRGITYEQLIDKVLNDNDGKETPEVKQLNERIKKMEEAETERLKEIDVNKQRQLANEYTNRMKEQISKSDKYEILNATGSYQLVIDTIYEEYQNSGKELEFDMAAKMVENFLESRLGEQMTKLTKINKIRKKLGLDIEKTTQEDTEDELIEEVPRDNQAPVKKVTKTLSNRNTSASPIRVEKPLTHDERKALFAQKLRGNMKGII